MINFYENNRYKLKYFCIKSEDKLYDYKFVKYKSEEHELFPDITNNLVGNDLQQVEVDSLGEGSALANHSDVSFLNGESGRAVNGDVSVSLLVSVILGHIVQVIPSHNNGSLHFG